MTASGLSVDGIVKRFGATPVLNGLSLDIQHGEIVALLGPSGSGKTTLLRIIAGLDQPDGGSVLLDGRDITGTDVRDRRFGFVFQHYALFRHMSVFDNIAFGLEVRRRKPPRQEIRVKVEQLLDLVQLSGYGNRLPAQLSGGQRQRIALARALAIDPQVLLLDEPFGALDAQVRRELRRWLRSLHDELNMTSVFVTHDQDEAAEVADRVVIINQGRIEQVASPSELYARPANRFVHEFVGDTNRFDCRVTQAGLVIDEELIPHPGLTSDQDGVESSLFVRPGDFALTNLRDTTGQGFLAEVKQIVERGPIVKVLLQGASTHFEIVLPRAYAAAAGLRLSMMVRVRPLAGDLFVGAAETPVRLSSDYAI